MTDDRYESDASERLQARELAQGRKFARIKAQDATREATAYLPDPDADLDVEQSVEIVDRFLTVRDARLGELAAPVSSLADDHIGSPRRSTAVAGSHLVARRRAKTSLIATR